MAPIDIIEMDLVRRQGDVSGTLITIAPGGQAANIGNWTFTFSVQLGSTLQTVSWTPPTGNASGLQMTTVRIAFSIPGYNSTVTMPVMSSTGIMGLDYLSIAGLGVVQAKIILDSANILIYNNGFPGNSASGIIAMGTPVFEASNVGQTVLVIPSTITDWNSLAPLSPTRSVGRFRYYLKYDTTDPSPGPFKKTFYQGSLYIQPQNDPSA